jgi:hypothetical protein
MWLAATPTKAKLRPKFPNQGWLMMKVTMSTKASRQASFYFSGFAAQLMIEWE